MCACSEADVRSSAAWCANDSDSGRRPAFPPSVCGHRGRDEAQPTAETTRSARKRLVTDIQKGEARRKCDLRARRGGEEEKGGSLVSVGGVSAARCTHAHPHTHAHWRGTERVQQREGG